jgi:hypothetical protein
VVVRYAGGARRPFRVVARRHYLKGELPRGYLFSPAGPARLALVTCGGAYDARTRSYAENTVVYAVPA